MINMSLDIYGINKKKIREYNAISSMVKHWSEEKKHNTLTDYTNEVFRWNITHNLTDMAEAIPTKININNVEQDTNMYLVLWHPEKLFGENTEIKMKYLTKSLEIGLQYIISHEKELSKFNPDNYWGHYNNLLDFIVNYIRASYNWSDAIIKISC